MSFRKIEFGKTSGESEAAEMPHLVADGYFDEEILKPIFDRKKWLVLARKGAGKSLLGEKIKQKSSISQGASAATLNHLADFPFKTFSQMLPSADGSATKYPTSWSWLLCLQILDALQSHPRANKPMNIKGNEAIGHLRTIGLLPTVNLQRIVLQSSKASFKAQIPKILEYLSEDSSSNTPSEVGFLNLVNSLKDIISNYSFSGDQYLVIDGLDDILTNDDIQYETLSALVFESNRLNTYFKANNIPVWIVVLCRTDIYEVLPGANKNKIRQDSAIEIDWYPASGDTEKSNLFDLINLRAKLSLKREVSVVDEFFPERMDHGVPTKKFMTELTRHTPRDIIALLSYIQKTSQDESASRKEIVDGAKLYSEKYFLPEIKDELVGYTNPKDLIIFINAVGSLHERAFTFQKLAQAAQKLGLAEEKLDVLLHSLFNASAIGMTWRDRKSRQNKFEFRFRNPNATFNKEKTIVLHKGLWKALNVS